MNDTQYTIDLEIPDPKPPLATAEEQRQVICESLMAFAPPKYETMIQRLRTGQLTTEMTVDGDWVSFVLRPVEA